MIIYGVPFYRLKSTMVDAYGVAYDVDTITNLSALKCFGCTMPSPSNDNVPKTSAELRL